MGNGTIVRQASHSSAQPHLRRVLSLWDLIFYGIVLIIPIAAPIYGIVENVSEGHCVTTILISMVAVMLTAFSYGRMAVLYPSSGSAYHYVSRGLNPHLGFLAGWAMVLEYLVLPVLCTIYASLTVQRVVELLIPGFPSRLLYILLAALFAGSMTFLNLRGIRATARANILLLVIMCGVVSIFIVLAIRYLLLGQGWGGVFSTLPFYNPQTFNLPSLATATSLAAATYIGFDGVTTLAEDAKKPKRNVLLATILVCLFTGIFGGLQTYLAQRVWPNWRTFQHLETAFMDVTRRVGGEWLFQAMGLALILANLGAGLTSQVGAARLLYGMGRENVLPKGICGYLDPQRSNPTYNIWIVGVLAFAGALTTNYEIATGWLNFGAFVAFMGVNLAALSELYFRRKSVRERNFLGDFLVPALGFLSCLGICLSLPSSAMIVGACWFAAGLVYSAIKTRGFRLQPVTLDFSEL